MNHGCKKPPCRSGFKRIENMKNLVQVLGLSYTGSTMIHLMLANAEDAFACGEIYAFFRPFRTHHVKPVCSCGRDYSECLWRRFDHTRESRFHATLAEDLDLKWIIDESKDLRWAIDSRKWTEKRMNVFSIIMVKDPRDWMHSQWKRGRKTDGLADAYIMYYKRFLDLGFPYICISLEELTKDPSAKLKRVCELIGMDYFEGKERFWEKQHCHLFGSIGIRRQMEKGGMEIIPEPEPPADFFDEARHEVEKLKSDELFIELYEKLMENEADNISGYETASRRRKRVVRPLWYHKDRLKSLYRKFYPQKWEYSQ